MEIIKKTVELLNHDWIYHITKVLMVTIMALLMVYAFRGWFV